MPDGGSLQALGDALCGQIGLPLRSAAIAASGSKRARRSALSGARFIVSQPSAGGGAGTPEQFEQDCGVASQVERLAHRGPPVAPQARPQLGFGGQSLQRDRNAPQPWLSTWAVQHPMLPLLPVSMVSPR